MLDERLCTNLYSSMISDRARNVVCVMVVVDSSSELVLGQPLQRLKGAVYRVCVIALGLGNSDPFSCQLSVCSAALLEEIRRQVVVAHCAVGG